MGLDELVTPKITLKIQGKEWGVQFKLRNFAALKQEFGMSENDLLTGLINGDISKIPYGIWAGTLVFGPFDPANPTKIEEQLSLEELFNLTLAEMKELNDKVVEAMAAYLPKQPELTEKQKEAQGKKQKQAQNQQSTK